MESFYTFRQSSDTGVGVPVLRINFNWYHKQERNLVSSDKGNMVFFLICLG